MIRETLSSGYALSKFERMLINQNVSQEVAHELCYGDVYKVLPKAKHTTPLTSSQSGDGRITGSADLSNNVLFFNQDTCWTSTHWQLLKFAGLSGRHGRGLPTPYHLE